MVRHLLGALLILALALLIGLAAMPVMAQDSVDWGGTGCAITPGASSRARDAPPMECSARPCLRSGRTAFPHGWPRLTPP